MTALQPMDMGQGEQPAIHPFFQRQRDFGSPKSAARDDILPHGATTHIQTSTQSNAPRTRPLPDGSSTTLEHDPNSSRRKRRKTEKTNEADSSKQSRITTPEDEPRPEGAVRRPNSPSASSIISSEYMEDSEPQPGGSHIIISNDSAVAHSGLPSELQSTSDLQKAGSMTEPTDTKDEEKKTPETPSPPRKTLRLNPNGKLLSSPVAKQSDDKPQRKRVSKRRKAGSQKLEQSMPKVVVIRYANETDKIQQLGKLIDNILSGRTKYAPPRTSTASSVPSVKKSQPPKPTHPFFLKPAMRKEPCSHASVPLNLGQEVSEAASMPDPKQDRVGSASHRTFLSSFKPRATFPESIHPVWPPKDLGHIRGAVEDTYKQYDDISPLLHVNQKKAKMAAVQILDKESILSTNSERLTSDVPAALRMPDRHVASGKILQQAVSPELSDTSLADDTSSSVRHPAVARVYSSIPQSLTAFDRGGYDTNLWTQKYAPCSADQVLQTSKEALMLRDWLKYLMVTSVDTGKSTRDSEKASDERKRVKRRKKPDKLDGFIVTSSDEEFQLSVVTDSEEDELAGGVTVSSKKTVIRSGDLDTSLKSGIGKSRMSNVILLSGPAGCGKTASVYAVAKELDYEVFEINPGNRRSAKDILERVGDMTRNHLVHNLAGVEEDSNKLASEVNLEFPGPADDKQNKLVGFFKPAARKIPKKATKAGRKDAQQEIELKRPRSQKQSFILLEEADILFEEDKQFWSGVMTLISQSKRPIIITCNDENLIPLEDISFHGILRYKAPPQRLVVDYLLILAANEGHMLRREAVDSLYAATGKDLRRSIMELNFWCQMAVGSEKSGLDWIIDRWPKGADLDRNGDPLRVISLNTYLPFMGWFGRDILLDDTLDSRIESTQEALHWWRLGLQDSDTIADSQSGHVSSIPTKPVAGNLERLQGLKLQSEYADLRSDLDVLCPGCSLDLKLDSIDTTIPPMSEKQRANYTEGYPLLQADLIPDYSSLSVSIGSTFEVFLGEVFRDEHQTETEDSQARKVLAKFTTPQPAGPSQATLLAAFEPVRQALYPPTGRLAPSFENGLRPLSEDLAPYIRAIMAFDLRLEQYRLQLSGLLSQSSDGKKRVRKTRASRAALEGGSKAETRKERWFPADTNPSLILATGNKEWQDLLVRNGHFTVAPMGEPSRECSDLASESSGDGGI